MKASRFTATGALVLFLALAASVGSAQVQLEREVFEVAGGLRCPICVNENVAGSNSPISVEMREIIREQLQEGRSQDEIYAYFVARYGEWILLEPPKRGTYLIVWLGPLAGGLLALAALAIYLRRWTETARRPIAVDADYLERVRQDLSSHLSAATRRGEP